MSTEGLSLTFSLREEIDDRMRALRVTLGEKTPSEYAFSNLYLFRQAHDYRYFPGPLPRITGKTYDGARHVLPLFDPRQASPAELAEVLRDQDFLFPVAEDTLASLDPSRLYWTDSPDDADYFYPAENFRTYRGDLLRKKYNLMQQLLASWRIDVKPLTEDTSVDAALVLETWMRDKKKLPGEADDSACSEALRLYRHFGMEGIVFYADERPAGFLIAQPFTPSVAVMRFAKGSDAYKGIYQYMFHHYCATRSQLQWINFEQDLGLANFRQTKRSYQPSSMLRKFRVRVRT
ncbi:phosphatidylglycerol lysyltransferase domain-containing protein [Noviherbaspirillum saxi]|nr:phosphatidylglycerol lysyltransferase domain-containing protein [Noviherbaspirillum saxi]